MYFWSFPTNRSESSFPTKCQQTVCADNSLLSLCIMWFVLFLFLVKCHTCQKSERHFSIVTRFCDGSCETFKTYRYFHKYPVSAQTLTPRARKAKEWISLFSLPARYQNCSWNLDFFFLFQEKTKTNQSTGIYFSAPQEKNYLKVIQSNDRSQKLLFM